MLRVQKYYFILETNSARLKLPRRGLAAMGSEHYSVGFPVWRVGGTLNTQCFVATTSLPGHRRRPNLTRLQLLDWYNNVVLDKRQTEELRRNDLTSPFVNVRHNVDVYDDVVNRVKHGLRR